MTCDRCRHRPGLSGYARFVDGEWDHMPCRCVTDQTARDLYGSTRNRMAMLVALRALHPITPSKPTNQQPKGELAP